MIYLRKYIFLYYIHIYNFGSNIITITIVFSVTFFSITMTVMMLYFPNNSPHRDLKLKDTDYLC